MTKEEFAQHVKSDTLPMYRLAYSILQNSAVLVPDGRILYIGASDGFQGTTAAGVDISGKDPEKTVLYYARATYSTCTPDCWSAHPVCRMT